MSCPNLLSTESMLIQYAVIDISSIVFCAFSLICLAQIVNQKNESNAKGSNLYKYLLVKSGAELAVFLIDVFNFRYYRSDTMYKTLQGSIWSIYFVFYIENSLFYIISLMEIVATLDCLISIRNKFKFLISNRVFFAVTLVIFIISFGFNSFLLLIYYIYQVSYQEVRGNSTYTVEFIWWKRTKFGFSEQSKNLLAAQVIIRDVAFLVLLIALNVMILYEIRKMIKRRMNMVNHTPEGNVSTIATSAHITNPAIHSALNAKRKKCQMIMASGCMYFFGHILYAIYQMTYVISPNTIFAGSWVCIYQIGSDLIMISYGYSFFLYFFFNTHFQKYVKYDILFVINLFLKLCGVDLKKRAESNYKKKFGMTLTGTAVSTTAHH